MNPEIKPPKQLKVFEVTFRIIYAGEISGQMEYTGKVLRKADTIQTAMQEVHRFFSRNPTLVPLHRPGYGVELYTPEFPTDFSGRTLNAVEVSAKELITKRLREGNAEEIESISPDEG